MKAPIIIIAGPTASGKTSFAIKLAQELSGEIINADSLQIYAENPILSAQPTASERKNIPHHLFGYIKGDEEYNVARWINDAAGQIKYINKTPIIVGGTGFYLKHLMFGLSAIPDIAPEVHRQATALLDKVGSKEFHKLLAEVDYSIAAEIEMNNTKRALRAYEVIKSTGKSIKFWQEENIKYFPVSSFKLVILQPDREILYQNCNKRFLDMLELGALEEVKYLLKQHYNPIMGIMKSHGIPELSKYLSGQWSLQQAIEKSQQVVRNYAKRQITWFRHQFNHPELEKCLVTNPEKQFSVVLEFCKTL